MYTASWPRAAMLAMGAAMAVAGTAQAAEPFAVTSTAFADGGVMALKYVGNDTANPNCTGANVSPPLQWSNLPANTASLVLLIYDQQGRNGLGVSHEVAYGIPPAPAAFKEGQLTAGGGYAGGKGTAGRMVYYGPCPPKGSGQHHYVFTLIATDLPPAALEIGLTREALLGRLATHALASAGLVGLFGQ